MRRAALERYLERVPEHVVTVLVRSGHVHDSPAWIRVTVGLPEENAAFEGALGEVLEEGEGSP